MPQYPYMIHTTILGYSYPYDTETNVNTTQAPGTGCLLHVPSPNTLAAKRAYIVQPVLVAGKLDTGQGYIDYQSLPVMTQIGNTNTGAPIFMGAPINDTDIADKTVIMKMTVPGTGTLEPISITLILIVAIIIAAAAAFISYFVSDAWKQYHAVDTILQAQRYNDEYLDVDTGEVQSSYFEGADIRVRTYANGELVHIALNDTGKEWLSGYDFLVIREGIDTDELMEKLFDDELVEMIKWAVIGVIAVGGTYLAVKLLTRPKQQPYYMPPQQPPPQLQYYPMDSRFIA